MARPRFSLRTLFLTVTAFSAVAFAFAAGISIVTIPIVWTLAYIRAPEATKYGTVYFVIGTITSSLLVLSIFHARELDRKLKQHYRLHHIAEKLSELEQF